MPGVSAEADEEKVSGIVSNFMLPLANLRLF